jgi:FkbM family methyltransferase
LERGKRALGQEGRDLNGGPIKENQMNVVRALSDDESGVPAGLLDAPWGTFRPGIVQKALIGLARRTFLHHGRMRLHLTRMIMRLGRPLDVEFRGCRYRIEGRNNLMDFGLLLHPAYNRREIDFLTGACTQGGVFVDIGANIGLYSLPLGKAVGATGRVISIDANPGVLARLAFNADASGLGQVTPVHCAVGDRAGRADLAIRRSDLSIVSIEENADGAMPMRPLLDILADQGVARIDALKIDIEGHEDAALVPFFANAPEALLPRRVVLEYAGIDGGDYPGCAAAFGRLGYRLAGRTRNNSLYQRG